MRTCRTAQPACKHLQACWALLKLAYAMRKQSAADRNAKPSPKPAKAKHTGYTADTSAPLCQPHNACGPNCRPTQPTGKPQPGMDSESVCPPKRSGRKQAARPGSRQRQQCNSRRAGESREGGGLGFWRVAGGAEGGGVKATHSPLCPIMHEGPKEMHEGSDCCKDPAKAKHYDTPGS